MITRAKDSAECMTFDVLDIEKAGAESGFLSASFQTIEKRWPDDQARYHINRAIKEFTAKEKSVSYNRQLLEAVSSYEWVTIDTKIQLLENIAIQNPIGLLEFLPLIENDSFAREAIIPHIQKAIERDDKNSADILAGFYTASQDSKYIFAALLQSFDKLTSNSLSRLNTIFDAQQNMFQTILLLTDLNEEMKNILHKNVAASARQNLVKGNIAAFRILCRAGENRDWWKKAALQDSYENATPTEQLLMADRARDAAAHYLTEGRKEDFKKLYKLGPAIFWWKKAMRYGATDAETKHQTTFSDPLVRKAVLRHSGDFNLKSNETASDKKRNRKRGHDHQ